MVEEDIEFTGSNREVLCKYVDGFVQILFNAKTWLNLCEVEVHGY